MSFNNGRYTLTKTGTMIPDAEGAWRKQGDVEALQRERDEAIERAEQCRKDRAMVLTVKTTDGLTASEWLMRTAVAEQKAKDFQTALDAEREKVKGLHEATKVICGHCCESMEIPSKAVLQSHLSTLQALLRALKGDANYTYHVADKPDEDDQYTVYVHVNGQGYGVIAEFYSRDEAVAYAEIKRAATFPATPTERRKG